MPLKVQLNELVLDKLKVLLNTLWKTPGWNKSGCP
jgi:hypothetical protein